MAGRLRGKMAVVTGGASGIGAAIVQLFAREEARVFSIDCGPQLAWSGSEQDIVPIQADISVEAEVEAAIREVIRQAGHVHILCSNAGIALSGMLHETTTSDWDAVLSVNLKGTYLTCKYLLPGMVDRGSGSIVVMSSGLGLKGSRSHHAYSAAKGGLVLLTRSIARSYGKYGIRANCVCPGPIDTPMLVRWSGLTERAEALRMAAASIPLDRVGKPEEVAYAALFLASDEASFVTGAVLAVDGGELS